MVVTLVTPYLYFSRTRKLFQHTGIFFILRLSSFHIIWLFSIPLQVICQIVVPYASSLTPSIPSGFCEVLFSVKNYICVRFEEHFVLLISLSNVMAVMLIENW